MQHHTPPAPRDPAPALSTLPSMSPGLAARVRARLDTGASPDALAALSVIHAGASDARSLAEEDAAAEAWRLLAAYDHAAAMARARGEL